MSKLFTPYQIGPVTYRNRFVRSATQDWLCDENGVTSELQLELYKNLAAGGVGLIITRIPGGGQRDCRAPASRLPRT